MITILSTRRVNTFWQLLRKWLERQFAAVIAEVRKITSFGEQLENLDMSMLAMEETTAKQDTLEDGIEELKSKFQEIADKAIPLEAIGENEINSLFTNDTE